jgi:hypothetical protein
VWNLEFIFHESTFVLPIHFLHYALKLSIKWQAAVILSHFNWMGKKWFPVTNSYTLCCRHVARFMCCVQWRSPDQLPTPVNSYTMSVRARPVMVAQPSSCTVPDERRGMMSTTCMYSIMWSSITFNGQWTYGRNELDYTFNVIINFLNLTFILNVPFTNIKSRFH